MKTIYRIFNSQTDQATGGLASHTQIISKATKTQISYNTDLHNMNMSRYIWVDAACKTTYVINSALTIQWTFAWCPLKLGEFYNQALMQASKQAITGWKTNTPNGIPLSLRTNYHESANETAYTVLGSLNIQIILMKIFPHLSVQNWLVAAAQLNTEHCLMAKTISIHNWLMAHSIFPMHSWFMIFNMQYFDRISQG